MKKQYIYLNDDIKVDLEKLIVSKLLVQANSGGGKSWANRLIIEQVFGKKQIIVIDPEGEFGNMRSKYDFLYIGKDGDAPAEPRSAALLAHRLLETKASAIIDIFELGSERKRFVRLFFEAMVNAPRNLWNDCIIILDEAHKFAPEKEESEALTAVVDMASLGRKRGFCLIPATQRPAKLSKDVAAECNNKLIGRASLDIDRKRSAEELGFNTKEEVLSLRNLEPGEFYAFGPAISRDVIKLKVGDVQVKPPKRGQGRHRPPAPTAKVRKLLEKFKDLPAEAEEEARTVADLKKEVTGLKRLLTMKNGTFIEKQVHAPVEMKVDVTKAVERAIVQRDAQWKKIVDEWNKYGRKIQDTFEKIRTLSTNAPHSIDLLDKPADKFEALTAPEIKKSGWKGPVYVSKIEKQDDKFVPVGESVKIAEGERKVLNAVAQHSGGMTRKHITTLTNYKRSTRDAYVYRLTKAGLAREEDGKIFATDEGIALLGSDFTPIPTGGSELQAHMLQTLPEGQGKILELLIAAYPGTLTRDQITEATGFQRSTRDAYVYRLKMRDLVDFEGKGSMKASDKLF